MLSEGPIEAWFEEQRSAYLYRRIAARESEPRRAEMFRALAAAAEVQSKLWAARAREAGDEPPASFRPELSTRLLALLIGLLGPRPLRTMLPAHKLRGMSVYDGPPIGHAMPERVEDIGKGHQQAGRAGDFRAAVFGANDGLVSNAGLVIGMCGAAASQTTVLLTGLTGLLAGAWSMAAGEYVSVRAQKEMLERQLSLEADELALYPEEEAAELALIYEARGLAKSEAQALGLRVVQEPRQALNVLAREELGLDPTQIASPWSAAVFSFLFFSLGALVPVLPFFWDARGLALELTMGLTAAALLALGAGMSLFTGRSALWSALRMLVIGAIAGGLTFGIGRLLSLAFGGE